MRAKFVNKVGTRIINETIFAIGKDFLQSLILKLIKKLNQN